MAPGNEDLASMFSNLVRLEISLWNDIDHKLEAAHGLPLGWFVPMRAVSLSKAGHLRVNQIAEALMVTVGGTSKLVDRITEAGYFQREPDPEDRRASRIVLTAAGKHKVAAAAKTQRSELRRLIGDTLDANEQRTFATLVKRLLDAYSPTSGEHHRPRW